MHQTANAMSVKEKNLKSRAFLHFLFGSLMLLSVAALSNSAKADLKRYEARLDQSKWQFDGNPLGCRLKHTIPRYGDAVFHQSGGRHQHLAFYLGYKRQKIQAKKVGWIRAMSPAWYPLGSAKEMGQVALLDGPAIIKADETRSWRMLSELEVGRFPTLGYQEFTNPADQVQVSISAVGFKEPYDKFLNCLSSLVEYDLPELKKMTLHFDFDKASVRAAYRKKLNALANYVKYDPNIEIVFLAGYTDAKGSRAYNQKLAQKRIAAVKTMLQLDGVNDKRFKTIAWGENNPVASNRTERGRALNRRVFIRISTK